jgi:hypothetical protein
MKRTIGMKFCFLFAMMMYIGNVSARECDSSCTMKAGHQYGFLSAGISWFDNAKLNGMLVSSNLPKLKEYAMTASIGGFKEMRRMTMENVITGNFWKDKVLSNQRVSLWSGDLFCNCGFNTVNPETPFTLFPYVGFGLALNTMQVKNDTKSFSEFLTSTATGTENTSSFLSQGTVLFNAGLGSDLFLVKPDSSKSMVIGIRAGYSYDLYTAKKWYSHGTAVSDLPSLNRNGGYIRLVVGGMGNHKKTAHCAEKCMKTE